MFHEYLHVLRLFLFVILLRKCIAYFLLIISNGIVIRFKHFSSQINEVIIHTLYHMKVSRVLCVLLCLLPFYLRTEKLQQLVLIWLEEEVPCKLGEDYSWLRRSQRKTYLMEESDWTPLPGFLQVSMEWVEGRLRSSQIRSSSVLHRNFRNSSLCTFWCLW